MPHVLIVIGSARKGRVADKILEHIQKDLEDRAGVIATVADLKEINLPFFDNEHSPASPDYAPTNQHVLEWQKLVSESDSVLFITPEYNHTLSAIQKNAFDSIYSEWENKPIAVVAYGWSGGSQSIATLNDLIPHIKGIFAPYPAQLTFMKDIKPDGTSLDAPSVTKKIKKALDQIV
jgi:NAD(P)H-dependent FMN reductase